MSSIVFRCDASLLMGSGHVMRCRTLARMLKRRGASITFLCRHQPGDLISLLETEFSVFGLPAQPLAMCEKLGGRPLYSAWLGCSQEEDAAHCIEVLAEAGISCASWLVVDHYGLDARWQVLMRSRLAGHESPRLLVLDDLADRQHQADLLLDQNFLGNTTETRYQGLVPTHCRQLLGPHYALLGPEYPLLYPNVPARTELRRVLVFFGGADPSNLTARALEALMAPELAHLAVDVVIGRQSLHRQAVTDLVTRRPHTSLYGPLESLAGLIARADLAIGAGGATTWERACLGLPTIVVSVAANQLLFADCLDRFGHLQLLGDTDSATFDRIRAALIAREAEPFRPEAGSSLTDGWGASRVATAMLGSQKAISLRLATAQDEALLLRWANDPHVRANSFSPHLIHPNDHHRWMQATLASENRLLFIAVDVDGCPLGHIRFDRLTDNRYNKHQALIGFSLDRAVRGHGLASDLVRLGLKRLYQLWGPHMEAVAEVMQTNVASNACFSRLGFLPDSASSSSEVTRWRFVQPCDSALER